ncbi:MAG: ABC transporter substrate-binding protein [Austwickia sp.]|nr:ABC transporter substrate-binding protein [Austwickia sp.]MBK9102261.1 ABC transporter substrate-binding protein [Austwickia sp.]
MRRRPSLRPGRSEAATPALPRRAAAGVVACLALGLAACGAGGPGAEPAAGSSNTAGASGGSAAAISLTDFHGRQVRLERPSQRSVFLVENAMNTMLAVGGGERIVGTGEIWQPTYKTAFLNAVRPGFSALPVVGSKNGTYDVEALAALKPDFVVLWAQTKSDKAIAAIADALKVPVYAVFLRSFEDLDKLALDLAAVAGKPARGEEINALVKEEMGKIATVVDRIPAQQRPTVYWMWGDIFGTAGTTSSASDLIEAAGGRNVLTGWKDAAAATEHPVVSMETLVRLDPDVIYMWYNQDLDPADIVSGKKVGTVDFSTWRNLKAVKNLKVFELKDPFVYDMMTGRLPAATAKVAKDINPAPFATWDVEAGVDRLMRAMYGVRYPGFAPTS